MRKAPPNRRRTSRKRRRETETESGRSLAVIRNGYRATIVAISTADTIETIRHTGEADNRTILSTAEKSRIVSSEELVSIPVPIGTAGSMLRNLAFILLKTGASPDSLLKLDSRDSYRLEDVRQMSGSELTGLLREQSGRIELERVTCPQHELPGRFRYVQTLSALPSASAGHQLPVGRRVNTGSRPNGQRDHTDAPRAEEIGRAERTYDGTSPVTMTQGGHREIERQQRDVRDYHQEHIDNLPV